jgi:hypothetical protein
MSRILHSIPLKICLSILLIEIVMLTCIGGFYSHRFAREVDAYTSEKLALPALLMSDGVLDYSVVNNLSTLSRLINTTVLTAFVAHRDGTVAAAATPDVAGRDYLSLLEPRERELFGQQKNLGRQLAFTTVRGERVVSTLLPLNLADPNIGSL